MLSNPTSPCGRASLHGGSGAEYIECSVNVIAELQYSYVVGMWGWTDISPTWVNGMNLGQVFVGPSHIFKAQLLPGQKSSHVDTPQDAYLELE